jgi:glutamine synthetase
VSSSARPRRSARAARCAACSTRAKKLGFEVKVGFEYEFFVFAETPESIREKGYRNLKPISPGFFGYSMLRNSVLSDFYKDLLGMCEAMDMGIEGLHTETGAGVLEAALRVDDGARRRPTRRPCSRSSPRCWRRSRAGSRPSWPNGRRTGRAAAGHMHMSLWKDGKPVFFDDKAPHRMSKTMRQFVGGQAGADAGAARHGRLERQFLPAADSRASGRRPPRPGASRTAPARCA